MDVQSLAGATIQVCDSSTRMIAQPRMPSSKRSRLSVTSWAMGRTVVADPVSGSPDRRDAAAPRGSRPALVAANVRASCWHYWEVTVRKLGMVLAGLGGFLV